MAKNPESKLVDKMLKRLRKKKRSCWMKLHGGLFQMTGLPDIVGCHKGRFIAIEVKLPGEEDTLTKRQRLILKRLIKAGARAGMATNMKEVRSICHGTYKLT